MKTGIGVQAILTLYLRNLGGFNVGITDEKEILIASFRSAQVACYTYQVS
jgi:hypothetical protein